MTSPPPPCRFRAFSPTSLPTRHAIPSGALLSDVQRPQSQTRRRGICSAAAWDRKPFHVLSRPDDSLFLTGFSPRDKCSGHDFSVQREMSAASLALRSRAEKEANKSFLAAAGPRAAAGRSALKKGRQAIYPALRKNRR